jgi:hypothetical protein
MASKKSILGTKMSPFDTKMQLCISHKHAIHAFDPHDYTFFTLEEIMLGCDRLEDILGEIENEHELEMLRTCLGKAFGWDAAVVERARANMEAVAKEPFYKNPLMSGSVEVK